MRKEELRHLLHKVKDNKQVVVYIEDGLYYPLKELIETEDYIILKCRDVQKVEE